MITLFRPSSRKASGFRIVEWRLTNSKPADMPGFKRIDTLSIYSDYDQLTAAEIKAVGMLGQYCDCVPSKEAQS
jgi:hypothetical protein